MARFRIRHIMLLVVYVAVVPAWFLSALNTTGPERGVLVFCSVFFVPALLAAVSACILPPGPLRLWLTAFFVTSQFVKGAYFRCGVCDGQALLTREQYRQGCPRCGKHTLIYKEYLFCWCLGYGKRCKRLRRRDWEEVMRPQVDHFYWLGTWAHLFRSTVDRVVKLSGKWGSN
jgi:ribosomal protein L37E